MRQLEKLGGVRVYHAERSKTVLIPISTFNDKRKMQQLGYTEIREDDVPQAPPMAINLDVKDVPEEGIKPKEDVKPKAKKKPLTKDELKNIAKDGN